MIYKNNVVYINTQTHTHTHKYICLCNITVLIGLYQCYVLINVYRYVHKYYSSLPFLYIKFYIGNTYF